MYHEYQMKQNINTVNSDFYNASGDAFDKIPFGTTVTDILLKYLPRKKILEIGPGGGSLAAWLEKNGCSVTCVEPAENLAKKAIEKGLNVHVTTIQDFFTDKKFDMVLAISSLIHVPKEELALQIQKIASFLHPKGLFMLSYIEGKDEGFDDPTNTGKMRFFAKWEEAQFLALVAPFFELIESCKIYNEKMQSTFVFQVYTLKE